MLHMISMVYILPEIPIVVPVIKEQAIQHLGFHKLPELLHIGDLSYMKKWLEIEERRYFAWYDATLEGKGGGGGDSKY